MVISSQRSNMLTGLTSFTALITSLQQWRYVYVVTPLNDKATKEAVIFQMKRRLLSEKNKSMTKGLSWLFLSGCLRHMILHRHTDK